MNTLIDQAKGAYQTLIIGEHRVDDRDRIELVGPDSLAVFVPAAGVKLRDEGMVLCADGVILNLGGMASRLQPLPPGYVTSYQVTAAHCMVKTYQPGIGDRALLIQEAQKRNLRVRVPSQATAKPTGSCRCDIRNLMSAGHDAGCPERR